MYTKNFAVSIQTTDQQFFIPFRRDEGNCINFLQLIAQNSKNEGSHEAHYNAPELNGQTEPEPRLVPLIYYLHRAIVNNTDLRMPTDALSFDVIRRIHDERLCGKSNLLANFAQANQSVDLTIYDLKDFTEAAAWAYVTRVTGSVGWRDAIDTMIKSDVMGHHVRQEHCKMWMTMRANSAKSIYSLIQYAVGALNHYKGTVVVDIAEFSHDTKNVWRTIMSVGEDISSKDITGLDAPELEKLWMNTVWFKNVYKIINTNVTERIVS